MKTWVVALLLATSLACGLLPQMTDAPVDQPSEDEGAIPKPDEDAGWAVQTEWPEYLPDDIPVLDGGIRTVLGGPDGTVRLFLEPLSKRQEDRYVAQCRDSGFEVTYEIFTQEGFPDRSEERMQAGEYDAVLLTKERIRMRLENGSDSATMSIDGFAPSRPRPTPEPLFWPEKISDSVPQPDGCRVDHISDLAYGGYQIACAYEDNDVGLDTYVQTLTAMGFREVDRLISDQDQIVEITLESETLFVRLMPHTVSATMALQVTPLSP